MCRETTRRGLSLLWGHMIDTEQGPSEPSYGNQSMCDSALSSYKIYIGRIHTILTVTLCIYIAALVLPYSSMKFGLLKKTRVLRFRNKAKTRKAKNEYCSTILILR